MFNRELREHMRKCDDRSKETTKAVNDLRTETKADIGSLRSETKSEFEKIRTDVERRHEANQQSFSKLYAGLWKVALVVLAALALNFLAQHGMPLAK